MDFQDEIEIMSTIDLVDIVSCSNFGFDKKDSAEKDSFNVAKVSRKISLCTSSQRIFSLEVSILAQPDGSTHLAHVLDRAGLNNYRLEKHRSFWSGPIGPLGLAGPEFFAHFWYFSLFSL